MKVWVAVYEHRHGNDTCVYALETLAREARLAIVDQWWEREIGNDILRPEDRDEAADLYFERMSERNGEYFTITECDIIGNDVEERRIKRCEDALKALVGPRLFNCCTDDMPPDWSKFRSLEVGGCIDHDGSTEGGVPDDKAQFWTVYARDQDNLAEAITDTKTRDKGGTRAQADALAAELSALSGLEVLS